MSNQTVYIAIVSCGMYDDMSQHIVGAFFSKTKAEEICNRIVERIGDRFKERINLLHQNLSREQYLLKLEELKQKYSDIKLYDNGFMSEAEFEIEETELL